MFATGGANFSVRVGARQRAGSARQRQKLFGGAAGADVFTKRYTHEGILPGQPVRGHGLARVGKMAWLQKARSGPRALHVG